eukprot:COSAG04_NODE_1931_length_5194_cov_1.251816_2_plen_271_part_00
MNARVAQNDAACACANEPANKAAHDGKEIPADWMWPELSQDQVKKYSSAKKDGLGKRPGRPRGSAKGKLKGVGGAKCEKKQALAVATSEKQAGGKSVVDDRAERSKLLASVDKQRVVGAVIQQRLWNPELHKDDSRLDAAITEATKQILQQSGQLTWRARKVISGEARLAESFVQYVRIAVRAMPEEMFEIARMFRRIMADANQLQALQALGFQSELSEAVELVRNLSTSTTLAAPEPQQAPTVVAAPTPPEPQQAPPTPRHLAAPPVAV